MNPTVTPQEHNQYLDVFMDICVDLGRCRITLKRLEKKLGVEAWCELLSELKVNNITKEDIYAELNSIGLPLKSLEEIDNMKVSEIKPESKTTDLKQKWGIS